MLVSINCLRVNKISYLLAASLFVTLIAQLFVAAPAQAECRYGEDTYQTGDTVGPYVCMPDGSWKRSS